MSIVSIIAIRIRRSYIQYHQYAILERNQLCTSLFPINNNNDSKLVNLVLQFGKLIILSSIQVSIYSITYLVITSVLDELLIVNG